MSAETPPVPTPTPTPPAPTPAPEEVEPAWAKSLRDEVRTGVDKITKVNAQQTPPAPAPQPAPAPATPAIQPPPPVVAPKKEFWPKGWPKIL